MQCETEGRRDKTAIYVQGSSDRHRNTFRREIVFRVPNPDVTRYDKVTFLQAENIVKLCTTQISFLNGLSFLAMDQEPLRLLSAPLLDITVLQIDLTRK